MLKQMPLVLFFFNPKTERKVVCTTLLIYTNVHSGIVILLFLFPILKTNRNVTYH